MRKIILSCIFVFLISNLQAADYYWVGGAGSWTDINHWATTSGGAVKHSIVPTQNDDVYFDANSGLANGNIITMPTTGHAYCRNMSWVGVTTTASFRNNGNFYLYVYGNLELAASVTYAMMRFEFSGAGNATFKMNGAARVNQAGWYNPFNVNKPGGSLTLLDGIPAALLVTGVYLQAGDLNFGGNTHYFENLGTNNENVKNLDVSNAILEMSGTWDYRGSNSTLNATGSYIKAASFISAGFTFPKVDIKGASDQMVINNTTFGELTFTNPGALPGSVRIGAGNVIDRLEFQSHSVIRAGGNIINELILAPGKNHILFGNNTVNELLQFNTPDCSGVGELEGRDVTPTLTFAPTATIDIRNAFISGMTAVHSTLIPVVGADGGGNTGWDFQPPAAGTTLYWVGGAGDWHDKNHWSLTSGGAGGDCVPFSKDDVVFDANSGFTAGNNTVTSGANAWCHNMTWTNVTAAPTFAANVNYRTFVSGSLTLDPTVTMNVRMEMEGNDVATWTSNGSTLGDLDITIKKALPDGSITITDDFNNPGVIIRQGDGKLLMPGRTLTFGYYISSGGTRTIDISNATLTLTERWALTGVGRTWVNNGAGSFITAHGEFTTSGLAYPKVHCTTAANLISIRAAEIGELVFTNPSPTSLVQLHRDNIINTVEFKGAGKLREGTNTITNLLLAPSRTYNVEGNHTVTGLFRSNSPGCEGLGELRGFNGITGTITMGPSATTDLNNIYVKDMTAAGTGIPLTFNGADAGGNTGFNITSGSGGDRYWVGGSGDWNETAHWSTTSGGPGGACVPTVDNDVFFDANSFTAGNSAVTITQGNAYCRNIDWTGASNAPTFTKDAALTLEIWGNLVMNPAVTPNAKVTFAGPANTTLTSNGASLGNLSIFLNKSAGSSLTFLDDYSNTNSAMDLISGGLNLNGRTITAYSISDNTTTGSTSIDIRNATITTRWHYMGSNKSLQADGSHIIGLIFRANGGVYNSVDVRTVSTSNINISGTTFTDLLFSDPSASSQALIGANNTIERLEFKGRGSINGTGNTIGTLIFFPGKVYTFAAGSNTTITNDWFGSGTPCNLTEITSSSTTANATITKTSGDVEFDYVRIRRITAAGVTPFVAKEHSEDMGNNVNWSIAPYNGTAPITGLGPDITLCADAFPHTLNTDGFFASPLAQYVWSDASTGSSLVVNDPGTYSVTVTFPDACSVSGDIIITRSDVTADPITGTLSVCEGLTTTLSSTTTGGTWSTSDAAVATIDAAGVVTGVAAGTATITYTVTNGDGCSASQTAIVTVNAPPVVDPITGTTSVCIGFTTTLSNTTTGGDWTTSDAGVATVNAGVVTGVATGTATITYTVTSADGCIASQTATVTVNALPTVNPITGTTNVCIGGSTTLSSTTAGGIWSTSDAAVVVIDAAGVITGVATGNANIIYTVTNADGCENSQTVAVTVNALPVVAPITGTTAICVDANTTLASTTAGGTWSTSDAAVATIDAAGVVTGVAAGTVTITYTVTNASGCIAEQTATVTINALPTVDPITGTTDVCVGANTTLASTTTGGTWSTSDAAVATINTTGEVTGVAAGTATITYTITNADGCESSQTAIVTVNALPSVDPISGANTVCIGSTTTLSSATTGGTWSTSDAAVATINATGEVTGVTSGTAVITYTVTNAAGCEDSETITITVSTLPTVPPITGTTTLCAGATTTLSNTTTGGTWSSDNTAVATVNAAGEVTGVSSGTATITYTVSGGAGCTASQTATVTVNALPTVDPITGTTDVCVGANTTLASTTTGGTWSTSDAAVATVNATGEVTGVAAGTATITYTVTNADGCESSQTATVTVNALPTVDPITGTTDVCVGANTTLASATTGGTWSTSDAAVATVNATGEVTGVAAGTATITYTVTNAAGCESSQTATVTVNALPTVDPITGTTDVCVDANTTLASTTTGGTWSTSDAAVATINATGEVTGVAAGTATITYTVTNAAGCESSQTTTVTVNALPTVDPITGTTDVCVGANTTLASTTTGGTWNTSDAAVATINATGEVTGVAAGTATITYTVTNAAGCESSQTTTVTVNALPTVDPITGTTDVCVGANTTLASATTGGTWSTSDAAVATVNATGEVTGVVAGTATITYTVTNATGCESSQTATVTVNAMPTVDPITGTTDVCVGANTTLASATTGGTWNTSDAAIATINATGEVTGVAAGTATITYTLTNAAGCESSQTTTVTVNALPTVDPITGTTDVCVGANTTLASTTTGGTWSTSDAAIATINATGEVTGVAAGTATIMYTVTNAAGCESSQTATVTVNAMPTVDPITGTTDVCIGSSTTLSSTTAGGTWSTSDATIATINAGVVTGVAAGTATITYTITNAAGCESSQTATITVNALPTVAPITGTTDVCVDANTILASATTGGTWSTSDASVATISTTGEVTGVAAGTATITYTVTNAAGCESSQTATVTVNAMPTVDPITGTTDVCVGANTILTSATTGGTWSTSDAAVATINATGEVTGVAAGTATITYTVTNAAGCESSQTATVTVNAMPTVAPITGTTDVCTGSTTTLSSTTAGGTWSTSDASIATINAGVVTGVAAGTATITYTVTNAAGCESSQTATITVNALPTVAPITGTTDVCAGSTTTLSSTTAGGTWSTSDASIATINAGVVTGVMAGTATITYTVTNAAGCESSQTATVTVNAMPVADPITGPADVCVGSTITLSSTAGGTWSSSDLNVASIDANGVVTGIGTGTATITYTVTNGCTASQTATITVNALPTVAPITGTTTVCAGENTTLASATSGGVWSTSNAAIATINGGVVTGVAAGTVTITYTVTNAAGCESSQTITVTIENCANSTPPQASNDAAATSEGTPVTIPILANDVQQNGSLNPASVSITQQPAHGSITVNANGSVVYTPANGYTGSDSFTYTVSNLNGYTSNTATVTITVKPLPVAADDNATTNPGNAVTIPVLVNDTGTPDLSGTVITEQPKHGSLTINPDGTIVYTPQSGYKGMDAFRYRMRDTDGLLSNEAVVSLIIGEDGLFIPNAITPNNDGKNDRFVIPGIGQYPGTTLAIFNRWGNEVYYSPNYDNRWDGNGLSGGTYYYILKLNTPQGIKTYKGWIQLLR